MANYRINSDKLNALKLLQLLWIRFSRLRRFGLASILIFSFSLGMTVFLTEFIGFQSELSFAITVFLATIFGFFVNRIFVYKIFSGPILSHFLRYVSTVATFRGVDLIAFFILVTLLDIWYPLAMIIILPTTALVKYIALKLFVFRDLQLSKKNVVN